MKKILITLLGVSYLLGNVFAVNNVNTVENNINEIKSNIKETNTTLQKEDIDYLFAFFDEIKAEMKK